MEDFDNTQGNKSHKRTREKIEKRRKQEKIVKKQKKIKKKQNEAEKSLNKKNKHSKHHKTKKGIIRFDKIKKTLKKFLKVFQEDLEDLFSIFENLDQGGSVDVSEIENPKIQKYLMKIFKCLLLINQGTEFKRNPEKNQFSLRQKIKSMIENSFVEEESSSSSESGSESSNVEKAETLLAQEKIEKKEINIKESKEGRMEENFPKELDVNLNLQKEEKISKELDERFTLKDTEIPSKKIYGPSFISESEKQKFLSESLSNPLEKKQEREEWMNTDNLTGFIDDSFKKLDEKDKKKSDPTKKPIPKYLEGLFKKNIDSKREQPKNQEEIREEAEIKEYMKEYAVAHNREKSLMELHKEKLKNKKKGGTIERRPFDRDHDLQPMKHDSKKVFQILNSGDFSLGNRFDNSKFEKSFL